MNRESHKMPIFGIEEMQALVENFPPINTCQKAERSNFLRVQAGRMTVDADPIYGIIFFSTKMCKERFPLGKAYLSSEANEAPKITIEHFGRANEQEQTQIHQIIDTLKQQIPLFEKANIYQNA